MNGKQYDVVFYNPSVKKDVEDTLRQFGLYREFDFARANLKRNPYIGDKIPESRWPSKYKRLSIRNLYRYVLSNRSPGWRLIYTIMPQGNVKILATVVDVLNHHRYDRMFGYG